MLTKQKRQIYFACVGIIPQLLWKKFSSKGAKRKKAYFELSKPARLSKSVAWQENVAFELTWSILTGFAYKAYLT